MTAGSTQITRSAPAPIVVAMILICGAVLRLTALGSNSFWIDEFTSRTISQNTLGDILGGKGFDRHTPPLYYVVLHFWLYLFPADESGIRLFSVAFDVVNIVLLLAIGSALFSAPFQYLPAALFAVSGYAIYYGQDGRMYSMLVSEILATFLIFLRVVEHRATCGRLAALAVIGCCGMYTHYYYAITLGWMSLAVLYLLLREHRNRDIAALCAAFAVIGLVFIPWVKVVASLASGHGQTFRQHLFSILPYALVRFVCGYGIMPLSVDFKTEPVAGVVASSFIIVPLLIPVLAAVAAGLYSYSRNGLHSSMIWFPLIAVPVSAAIVSLKVPMLSERYLVSIFPFFLLTAVEGVRNRGRWAGMAVFACLAASGLMHHLNPRNGYAQWRDVATLIDNRSGKVAVVVDPGFSADLLRYYVARDKDAVTEFTSPEETGAKLQDALGKNPDAALCVVQEATRPDWTSALSVPPLRTTARYLFPFENGLRVTCLSGQEPASENSPALNQRKEN